MPKKSKKPKKRRKNTIASTSHKRSLAAELPQSERYLSVSFRHRNSSCGFSDCGLNEIADVLLKTTQETMDVARSYLCKRPVRSGGNYKRLFKDLPEGTDLLYEKNLTKSGRIFYFLAADICHIVAIRQAHIK